MARLPQASDLQRRPAPTDSPNIRVGAIDFGPQAAAAKAIGDGAQSIGRAFEMFGEVNNEVDDYETRKKLLDFKLKSEIAHEEFKRSMPPGGGDYANEWNSRYQEMAKEFVGSQDAAIPQSQRGKVGLALKQHEVMLSERAQRAEIGEKDRFELEGLSGSLEDRKSLVASSPNQLDRFKAEALDMIENNPRLSPAAKAKLRKTYIPGLVEEAYRGRAAQAKSVDEYKAILDELKPDMRDKEEISIERRADGLAAVIAKSGAKVHVNASHAERFSGLIADLEAAGVDIKGDQSGGYNDRNIAGTTVKSKHASGDAIDLNWNENGRGKSGALSSQMSDEQINALAKKHGLIWGGTWKNRDDMHFEVDPRATPAKSSTAQNDNEPSYDGPHPELTQKQRRHLYNAVKDEQNKAFAGLHAQLKGQLSDDVESVRRTGKGSTTLDADFARKVLNANQMRNWEIQRKEAEYEFSMMDGLERLTMDAIAEKIDRIKPEPGDESFKAHQRATDKAIRFAGDLQKMRNSDPAGAVDAGPLVRVGSRTISADPEVAAARESKAGPHALMAARLKAQERLGIPPESQSPITKDEAKRLLAPLAGLKGDDLAKPLSELAVQIQKDYREHAPGVMRYIARTLYQDKASQEIVTDEVNKVLKQPGNIILDPRKLKELERIDQTEMLRRGGAAGSAPAMSYPRPNAAQIKMLVDNPHFAADFARKFGGKMTSEILDAVSQK